MSDFFVVGTDTTLSVFDFVVNQTISLVIMLNELT